MTPAVPFPRVELADLVQEIAEAPQENVVWDQEPLPYLGMNNGKPSWYVQLAVMHTRAKGIDNYRTTFDPVLQINVSQVYGYRIVTVNIKVVSYDPDTPSFDILE